MEPSTATAHHRNQNLQSEQQAEEQQRPTKVDAGVSPYKHHPTPTAATSSSTSASTAVVKTKKTSSSHDRVVNCNKCRPSSREKISVVPLDRLASTPSPGTNPSLSTSGSLRGFFSNLTRRSPRPSTASAASATSSWPTPAAPAPPQTPQNPSAGPAGQDETSKDNEDRGGQNEWRQTAAELSRKLLHATRRRDEAALEASRLRRSVADLEKKLSRLEVHCHELSSSLQRYAAERVATPASAPAAAAAGQVIAAVPATSPVTSFFSLDAFLRAISDARAAVRHLGRALSPAAAAAQSTSNASSSGSKSFLVLTMESQLSRALYEDFESAGFDRSSATRILDPYAFAESSRAGYESLKGLTWDEVVARGTRHYSEGLSRFCDRKMADVVALLGWGARPWPEPMLQAFFGAAKHVWLLHLLARSAHPAVPLFRVEKGARFDPIYMEEAVGSATEQQRARRMGAATTTGGAVVRAMVAPGFYVGSSVVKCKVVCSYDE